MKFKQPSRKTGRKTVRRAVSRKSRPRAGRKPVARTKKPGNRTVSRVRATKAAPRKKTRTTRRSGVNSKRKSPASLAGLTSDAPAVKPRKRRLAPATIPPRKHRVARLEPTPDTIPPFFPTLGLGEENLADLEPVFFVRGGQRIEVPTILLEIEQPHAAAGAGDGRLHVTARDPHWLYVHWDFTREQQAKLNTDSRHGHLIVRVYVNSLNSVPLSENHVHPQSRHWFAHVETPGATYYAELGFYAGEEWRRVAAAGPVTTPRKRFAFDTSATYRTIHPDRPLAEQPETHRVSDEASSPEPQPLSAEESASHAADWSPEQQLAILRALGVIRVAETVSSDSGAGGFAPAPEGVSERSPEIESVSSAGGGFGETPGSSETAGEFSVPASSADAPLFSLAEFPNPSS